jgi:hypothetical protein
VERGQALRAGREYLHEELVCRDGSGKFFRKAAMKQFGLSATEKSAARCRWKREIHCIRSDAPSARSITFTGCFVGLRPGRRNSGMSEPQMHINKEGDAYLRTLLVQGAHYILGPFGQDSDLWRWGLKLAERGGKNAKKRAVIAVARKLAVLLHKLWVSGEVYEPLRNNHKAVSAVA